MPIEKLPNFMLESGGTALPLTLPGQIVVRNESGQNVALAPPSEGQLLTGSAGSPERMAWRDPADIPEIPAATGGKVVGEIFMGAFAAAPALSLACDGSAVSRSTYSTLFAAIATAFGAGDGSTTFNVPDLRGRLPLGQGTGLFRLTVSGISAGPDTFTVPSSDLQTGAPVVYTNSGGAAPDPLVSGTTYFWIRLTNTTGKLATTRANAVAGTAINLLDAGSGTHTLQVNLTARTVGQQLGEENHSLTVAELASHTHTKGFQVGSGGNGGDVGAGQDTTGATGGSGEHNNMPPVAVVGFFIYAGA